MKPLLNLRANLNLEKTGYSEMSISSYMGESGKHLVFLVCLEMKFLEREDNVIKDHPSGVVKDAACILLFDAHGGNACLSCGCLKVFLVEE